MSGGRTSMLALAAAFVVIGLTRWPLVPKQHLFHIDNVNFALALDHFDPRLDQPQPPGYPLYVGWTKLLRVFMPRAETLFPVSGIIGSALALAAVWWLASAMFGARAGLAAGVLFALNPVFWLAGVGNYVRVYLALGAAIVAGFAWMRWHTGESRYGYFSAGALGLFAGFRPELALLLLPLVAIGLRAREAAIALGWMALAVAPWLGVTAAKTGGLLSLYGLNSSYLASQSRHTSLLYGATLFEAARMAAAALYWIFFPIVSWVWVMPLAKGREKMKHASGFLALWFLPPMLFYAFVHIHNPDQALTIIPAVCIVGGAAMARLQARGFAAALVLAAAFNVLLFFYPEGSPFRASNYRIAEYTLRTADSVYDGLEQLRRSGAVTVLWQDAFITPQEMGYYFPDIPVVSVAESGIRLHNQTQHGPLAIRAGKVAWMDPVPASEAQFFKSMEAAAGPAAGLGPFHVVEVKSGQRYILGAREISVTP